MRFQSSWVIGGACLLGVASVGAWWFGGSVLESWRGGESIADGAPSLVSPTRRAHDQPLPRPPNLPAGAEWVAPMTLEVRVESQRTDGRVLAVRQTVSRSADRVHVLTLNGPEWYFERNPRDTRRVSGFLVDHASRTIVVYSDSDMRNELGIPGWGRILTLGVEPDALGRMEASGEVRTVDGIPFARYVTERQEDATREVWWSSQYVLPAMLVTSDTTGRTRLSIERLRAGANADVLQPPSFRFPDYVVVDLADWHEQH